MEYHFKNPLLSMAWMTLPIQPWLLFFDYDNDGDLDVPGGEPDYSWVISPVFRPIIRDGSFRVPDALPQ